MCVCTYECVNVYCSMYGDVYCVGLLVILEPPGLQEHPPVWTPLCTTTPDWKHQWRNLWGNTVLFRDHARPCQQHFAPWWVRSWAVPAVWNRAWSRCCGPRCRLGHPAPSWWRRTWCKPARWHHPGDRKHGWHGSLSGHPTSRWHHLAHHLPEPLSVVKKMELYILLLSYV